ncbi:hypothetical protein SCLCIDRAFT_1218592, partial [Scleroderma citrinum Foug A]
MWAYELPRVSPLSELLCHFSCGPWALLQTMIELADDEKKSSCSDFVNKLIAASALSALV